ncbi:hypothetical protein ACFLVO_04865 [Chloroflexota bacterium]
MTRFPSSVIPTLISNVCEPTVVQISYNPNEPEIARKAKDERLFLKRFFGVFVDPIAWGSFLYPLFSLATGILYFTWVVTGISLSTGLIVLIIGLPSGLIRTKSSAFRLTPSCILNSSSSAR